MSTEEFVPVTGVVHLHDAHGIFLDVGGRRVFIPDDCLSMPGSRFAPGETVTVEVVRSFVKQLDRMATKLS
jgi:hypothetical protein